jgi:hypothetical protein
MRYDYIETALELVADKNDFGFSSRQSQAPVNEWKTILRWWLCLPGASRPSPTALRFWLGFCNSNFDFRFGVAVGAVLSNVWAENSSEDSVPTLSTWESKMKLPWVVFWIQELLRWGTLDPFVAYMLSSGHADGRAEAMSLRPQYDEWYLANYSDSNVDDSINPVRFRMWEKSKFAKLKIAPGVLNSWPVAAVLKGDLPSKLRVFPVDAGDDVHWYDAAGYLIAQSPGTLDMGETLRMKRVFYLEGDKKKIKIISKK